MMACARINFDRQRTDYTALRIIRMVSIVMIEKETKYSLPSSPEVTKIGSL